MKRHLGLASGMSNGRIGFLAPDKRGFELVDELETERGRGILKFSAVHHVHSDTGSDHEDENLKEIKCSDRLTFSSLNFP